MYTKFASMIATTAAFFVLVSTSVSLLYGYQAAPKTVTIVDNKMPESNAVSISLVGSIGGEDITDENYDIYGTKGIDLNSEGHLYTLSYFGFIRIYDDQQKFIRQFGKTGQGPGEFKWPYHIVVENDLIYVDDYGLRKVLVLNQQGKEVRRITLETTMLPTSEPWEGLLFDSNY